MNRAGAGLVPNSDRFHRTLHQRRAEVRGPARLAQQLLGLEAKMKQYELGEAFIEQIESIGGSELFATIWDDPSHLPDLAEIRDPERWLERVRPLTGLSR